MTPYFERCGISLYLGDARDVLPGLPEVDLLLTDPPYGVEWQSGFRKEQFALLTNDAPDDRRGVLQVLDLAVRRLRGQRHAYVFGLPPHDVESVGLMAAAELVWDRMVNGGGDLSSPWATAHEKITFAVSRGRMGSQDRGGLAARLRRGSVLRSQRISGSTLHPTEKPVDLLRQMIESSSLIGETVLDPFAGSGSTLVAALLEGRRAIGIEIEERYCAAAAGRLEVLTRQVELFDDIAPASPPQDNPPDDARKEP